ncbi:hypothetical protein [Rhodopila sp.]|uniref:hypothetical protein n=1 Tax=Rhodopila sp. TaxID=2480087 RepID=UPI003D13A96A
MVFIPAWVINVLFLLTVFLAGFQHVQLRRRNSVLNLQFFMMAFGLFMIVITTLCNQMNAWLSLGFLMVALASLALTIRQHRTLPPLRSVE